MRKLRRIASLTLTLMFLLGVLAASGASASAAKTDLLLWLPPFGTGDSLDMEFWTKTLQPWADQNNVNLSIEITPWGNYEEKYLTGFSSGSGPDVGYMYLEMFNDFIDMGALEPLEGYFTPEETANYLYYNLGNVKGHQYTVPFVVGNARILYFNKDILAKAGVAELPKTWDDLVNMCLKVKDAKLDGVMPFAQEWADPAIGALNNIFYPYFWQAGGELYNEDGSRLTLGDGDAAVRAAQFLYDLKFKYQVLPEECMSMSGADVREAFCQGKVACASLSATNSKQLEEAKINYDFVPSLTDKRQAVWVAADSLIMNSACKNKDLAASLIKFITSPATMEAYHKEVSPFPPLNKDEPNVDNPRFAELYSDAAILHTLPVAPNSFKMMDTLYKNLQLMMLGQLTPEEAIRNTVEYAQSIA